MDSVNRPLNILTTNRSCGVIPRASLKLASLISLTDRQFLLLLLFPMIRCQFTPAVITMKTTKRNLFTVSAFIVVI